MRQSRSHLHFSVPHIALLVLILPVLFSCSSNEVENLQAEPVQPVQSSPSGQRFGWMEFEFTRNLGLAHPGMLPVYPLQG